MPQYNKVIVVPFYPEANINRFTLSYSSFLLVGLVLIEAYQFTPDEIQMYLHV